MSDEPMVEPTLSSELAVQEIEAALFKFDERVGELWRWGYHYDMPEPHRWDAGRLYGYWLALTEEAEQMGPKFEAAREALEALPIIKEIRAKGYEVHEDMGDTDRLIGEQWCFTFRPRIVYTHREPIAEGGES